MPRALIVGLVGILLLFTGRTLARSQDNTGKTIVFHVTSVHQEADKDFCSDSDKCSATKFVVEGYADAEGNKYLIAYVLKCTEILAQGPPTHYTIVCARVHATNDYIATRFDDSIGFGDNKSGSYNDTGPLKAMYSIVSEKEIRKEAK